MEGIRSSWSINIQREGDDYEFKKSTNDFHKELKKKNLPNYYEILGISQKASKNEIKTRFRKLVKEWHPDKTKLEKSEKKMAEINKAYEVLSDDEKRKIYDSYLNE